MAGIITPEDNALLEKMLEEEPEARKIWLDINIEFSDKQLTATRKDLPNTIDVDAILANAEARERSAKRNLKIGWISASSLAAASFLGYWLLNPYFHPPKGVIQEQAPFINVTLSMDGQTISLSELTKEKAREIAAAGNNHAVIETGAKQLRHIKTSEGTTLIDCNGILRCTKTNNHQLATITVPLQKRYEVLLSDDTRVMLNAGTEITFPIAFNGSTREISIKGQAYLDVAPDPNKPFIVHLPGNEVKVLGTSFDVNTYDPANVQVALVKGSVSIHSKSDSVKLIPGKAAICQQGANIQLTAFDTSNVLAWQTSIYNFSDEPLSNVMDIIHREYGINITYDDPGVKNRKVLAWLDVTTVDVETFMKNLKLAQICNYRFKGTGKDSVLHISHYKN